MNKFTEDYYLRGRETGLSNYVDYSWKPNLTIPMAQALIKIMGLNSDHTILDYGCARGYLVHALHMCGIKAYGYDVSEWAIQNCHENVKRQVSNLLGHGYDKVFCKDVLEHVQDLEETLHKIFDICHEEALFIVPTTYIEGGAYIYPDDELDSTHIHRLTFLAWVDEVTKVAKLHGFIVYGSLEVPVLKKSIELYPGSAAFIYCKKV